ncbi:MAG: hypothetical protein ACP5G1_03805 [Nanopusillaceae archaeon]
MAEENSKKLDLGKLLEAINRKIHEEIGRNYAIGHAYFLQYAEKGSDGKMYIDVKKLNMVFRDKIIPLLQEYTNDDWEQMHDILQNKNSINKFIDKGNQNITDELRNLKLSIEDFKQLYE